MPLFLPILSAVIELKHLSERLLRHGHGAELSHSLLSCLLLFEQFLLSCYISAIALGEYVLAVSSYSFTSNDLLTYRGLDRYFELMPRYYLLGYQV